MRRLSWRKWLLALGGSAIVACAVPVATASATATSSTSSKPTKVVLTKYGFSVTLPSGWQRVSLTNAGINKMAKYLDRVDPALGQQFTNNESTARQLQLYAIGPPQANFLPNLNVLVQSPQDLPTGQSFVSQAQPIMKTELQQEGFKNVTTSVVHLRLGPAVEGQYSLPNSPAPITQLYISHRGHLYIVTMSPASVVPQIESTWHWL